MCNIVSHEQWLHASSLPKMDHTEDGHTSRRIFASSTTIWYFWKLCCNQSLILHVTQAYIRSVWPPPLKLKGAHKLTGVRSSRRTGCCRSSRGCSWTARLTAWTAQAQRPGRHQTWQNPGWDLNSLETLNRVEGQLVCEVSLSVSSSLSFRQDRTVTPHHLQNYWLLGSSNKDKRTDRQVDHVAPTTRQRSTDITSHCHRSVLVTQEQLLNKIDCCSWHIIWFLFHLTVVSYRIKLRFIFHLNPA